MILRLVIYYSMYPRRFYSRTGARGRAQRRLDYSDPPVSQELEEARRSVMNYDFSSVRRGVNLTPRKMGMQLLWLEEQEKLRGTDEDTDKELPGNPSDVEFEASDDDEILGIDMGGRDVSGEGCCFGGG